MLVKVNVDENPADRQAFQVQSIPAVYRRQGRRGRRRLRRRATRARRRSEFVESLLPTEEEAAVAELLDAGDEASLRAARCELEPGNEDAIVALAELLVDAGRQRRGAGAAGRIPETERDAPGRRAARRRRCAPTDDYDAKLAALLDQVKTDDDARQQFVDLLELMGPDDPRTADYRRQLTARLF